MAKTAPTSFFAAKLEELAKKWLDAANELEEVQIALDRYRSNERKAG